MTARNGLHPTSTSKIIEVAIPQPNGVARGLLVEFLSGQEGGALYVYPYRADDSVYLTIAAHANDCALMTRTDSARRCDCGACLTYDEKTRAWQPTRKESAR